MSYFQRLGQYLRHSAILARESGKEAGNRVVRSFGRPPLFPERIHEQWRAVLQRSVEVIRSLPACAEPGVLFLPIWGTGTAVSTKAIESVMAHAVRLRGVRAAAVSCHRALPACLLDPAGNHEPAPPAEFANSGLTASTCRHCARSLQKLYADPLVDLVRMNGYTQPSDLVEALAELDRLRPEQYSGHVFRGVQVGGHALASALRVTGRGTLQDTPYHHWLLGRQLLGSMVVVRSMERLLAAVRPRRIVITHGIYVDHGTVCETAKLHGVPVVVFARPYRKNTVMLCHGDTYHKALIDESTELWDNLSLSVEQEQRLDRYVDSRRTGSMDSITYHPNPVEGRDALWRELGLDPEKPLVSLFTNVMWDAQLYHACNAFGNMLEWIFETVEYFQKRPEIQLAIRVHPAEVKAVWKSRQPVAAEIAARYPLLPSHVRVIPPEHDLSSYDLVENSVAAIIYGTKMGLEIALRGIPVIVAGESFVRGKGFTHDACTREQYCRLLDALPNLPHLDAVTQKRARRYGYHFYFRRQIDFPFIDETDPRRGVRLTFDSLAELLPGRNRNLDAICAGLLEGREFLGGPSGAEQGGEP